MSTHALTLIQGGSALQGQESLVDRAIAASLSSLAPHSRRVYKAHMLKWIEWAHGAPLDREHVQKYLLRLESEGATAQVRNQALAALKKLALEAAELGWIDHAISTQIQKLKARRTLGIRTGRWLTLAQASALLASVDSTTLHGKRDAAVLALLLGCGLRRSEACSLDVAQLQYHDGRMLITNLVGKGGRVRTLQVPQWAQILIEKWVLEVLGVRLLRSIKADGTIGQSLSPSAIRHIVMHYGSSISISALRPHDLRRSSAKLSRLGGAPLETIQRTLGHASIKTTEVYLSTGEEANAGDFFTV